MVCNKKNNKKMDKFDSIKNEIVSLSENKNFNHCITHEWSFDGILDKGCHCKKKTVNKKKMFCEEVCTCNIQDFCTEDCICTNHCICGQKHIKRTAIFIRNKDNRRIKIGSCCIKFCHSYINDKIDYKNIKNNNIFKVAFDKNKYLLTKNKLKNKLKNDEHIKLKCSNFEKIKNGYIFIISENKYIDKIKIIKKMLKNCTICNNDNRWSITIFNINDISKYIKNNNTIKVKFNLGKMTWANLI